MWSVRHVQGDQAAAQDFSANANSGGCAGRRSVLTVRGVWCENKNIAAKMGALTAGDVSGYGF